MLKLDPSPDDPFRDLWAIGLSVRQQLGIMREHRPASFFREATHAADPVVVANLTPLSKNFGCFDQRSEPALLSWTNRTFGIHSTGIGSYVNRMVTSSKILRSKSSSFLSEPSGLRAFFHRTCNFPGSLWNRSVSHFSSRSVAVRISSTSSEDMVLSNSNSVLDATEVAMQLAVGLGEALLLACLG